MKHLACPIALHPDGAPVRMAFICGQTVPTLADFDHDAAPAAARHLFATMGLETRSAITIGMSTEVTKSCAVHFVLCRVAHPVRLQWKHQQPDGTLATGHWIAINDLPANAITRWIVANI